MRKANRIDHCDQPNSQSEYRAIVFSGLDRAHRPWLPLHLRSPQLPRWGGIAINPNANYDKRSEPLGRMYAHRGKGLGSKLGPFHL